MARGKRQSQLNMLGFIDLEERVPADHPLRVVKQLADAALEEMSPVFDAMYAESGRPSIPPERLLKANLLMALYSVRSERAFCEELDYHLLYRWFLDMDVMEPSFVPTTFSKNRQRVLDHAVADQFFAAVVQQADRRGLLSDEHFTVDGTLIEAAASMKSFRPTDRPISPGNDDRSNPSVDFRGQKRSNATHTSTTDPEARLIRKGPGKEARLSFAAHVLMENRHGMVVGFDLTEATGTAERDAVPRLLGRVRADGFHPKTVGADKGYDTKGCVAAIREVGVTPHVTQHISVRHPSAIDGRTTRHAGYGRSQQCRSRVEEIFGWMKTVGGFRRTRYRGVARTQLAGFLVVTAYNLVRMSRLLALGAAG